MSIHRGLAALSLPEVHRPGMCGLTRRKLAVLAPLAVLVFVGSAIVPQLQFRLSVADTVQCLCLVPIFWFIITQRTSLVVRMLNHPVVARVGVLSFSVYLFHRLVLGIVHTVVELPVIVDVVSLLVTLVLAQIVYVLVEKPCARLRKRLESRIPAPTAADGARV